MHMAQPARHHPRAEQGISRQVANVEQYVGVRRLIRRGGQEPDSSVSTLAYLAGFQACATIAMQFLASYSPALPVAETIQQVLDTHLSTLADIAHDAVTAEALDAAA
ncbi:hypothetical protein GCM10009760_26250 [Kitasatospora kazusensis]|uniref:Uncharacterized protein n=1 Tax=Kitasatospora kazusensis TaxID=407974 RepID=A0ABP5L4P9_9ACTN